MLMKGLSLFSEVCGDHDQQPQDCVKSHLFLGRLSLLPCLHLKKLFNLKYVSAFKKRKLNREINALKGTRSVF